MFAVKLMKFVVNIVMAVLIVMVMRVVVFVRIDRKSNTLYLCLCQ